MLQEKHISFVAEANIRTTATPKNSTDIQSVQTIKKGNTIMENLKFQHLTQIEQAEDLYYTALQAYDNREYRQALELFEKATAFVDDAMVNLGIMHLKGMGTERNSQAAVYWLNKAVQREHVYAAYYLAQMLERGIGIAADKEAALRNYELAAHKGDGNAQYRLGLLLKEQDPKEGMGWLIKAAHNNHAGAQEVITYVSNAKIAVNENELFMSLEAEDQQEFIEMILNKEIKPMLQADGGSIELVHYVADATPQLWLRYLGACTGCHLGSTSTADMILKTFEKYLGEKIVIYLMS